MPTECIRPSYIYLHIDAALAPQMG
jgi:hypothetical protein